MLYYTLTSDFGLFFKLLNFNERYDLMNERRKKMRKDTNKYSYPRYQNFEDYVSHLCRQSQKSAFPHSFLSDLCRNFGSHSGKSFDTFTHILWKTIPYPHRSDG